MTKFHTRRRQKGLSKKRRTVRRGGKFERPAYMSNSSAEEAYWKLLLTVSNSKSINTLVSAIQKKYNSPEHKLPKGTRLYRSAFEKDPTDLFSPKKDIFFFGLDAYISLWYALEMWQMHKNNRHNVPYTDWTTFMHEYEVVKPIQYSYLPDISTNPKNEPYYETCLVKPCVHPQRILHGSYGALYEIGTELTIPYKFPVFEYIKPVATHKVNLIKLLEMQDSLTDMEYPFSINAVLNTKRIPE